MYDSLFICKLCAQIEKLIITSLSYKAYIQLKHIHNLKKKENSRKIAFINSKIQIGSKPTLLDLFSYFRTIIISFQALRNKLLKMFTSLCFFVTVLTSPKCSIFLWYFFLQFSNVVDFNVSLKALVLNTLLYVNEQSKDDDFLLLIGLDHTPVVRFDYWLLSVLLSVETSKSVLIIGFFLVCDWCFYCLCMIFSILFKGTLRFVSRTDRFFSSKLLLF